ncbi:monovalent cation/H+ antiporter complex subunit F [Haloarchaeobius sp. HRN-SO-5]|uniref:monovalent cation/H+ antiporter complex subunit F n=1 Tax=Haloarchaeobius sp. HRN-SO-5 TaxID=3446118 RepID=UPI003EBF2A4E
MTGVESALVDDAMVGAALLVVVAVLASFYRVVRGPTLPDRVVAVNGIGTATVVVLTLLSVGLDEPGFIDIALVYALLNFLLSLGLAKVSIERGGVL